MSTMPAATETPTIVIRDIDGGAEMRAVEELQKEVWGIPDLDVVPLSHLVAAKAAGGVLLGAFDRETLIGFVYSFVSHEHGTVAHHSMPPELNKKLRAGYKGSYGARRSTSKVSIIRSGCLT
jgi:predicted GNAT superfamily acetyltransferase